MKLAEIFNHRRKEDDLKFKTWFGNSKILDDEGNPAICYHATTGNFAEFIPGGLNNKVSGPAMWFTFDAENQPAAHNISNRKGFKDGTNVMPVYIKMERPLVIDTKVDLEWARSVFANDSSEFPQIMTKEWVDEVSKDGEYDGIIFDAKALGWRDAVCEIIVFKPNQVKSALGNKGSFNQESNSITD